MTMAMVGMRIKVVHILKSLKYKRVRGKVFRAGPGIFGILLPLNPKLNYPTLSLKRVECRHTSRVGFSVLHPSLQHVPKCRCGGTCCTCCDDQRRMVRRKTWAGSRRTGKWWCQPIAASQFSTHTHTHTHILPPLSLSSLVTFPFLAPSNLLCFDILHNLFCGKCRVEGPATPSDQPSWLAALVADRKATWGKDGFNGTGVFNTPELEWTKTAYIQPQMHPFDRYFYSVEKGNYTVATYLDDVEAR